MAKNLLLFLASLLTAFLIGEVGSRLIFPIQYGHKSYAMDGKTKVSIAANDLEMVPDLTYRQIAEEFDKVTTHTSLGFRGPSNPSSPSILFIGDSMTYGVGLADNETIPYLYCEARDEECVNLGHPGTSTIRQLDILEHYLQTQSWRPHQVIIMPMVMTATMMGGNDLADNLRDQRKASQSSNALTRQPAQTAAEPRAGIFKTVLDQRQWILERFNLVRVVYYILGPTIRSTLSPARDEEELRRALDLMCRQMARLDAIAKNYEFEYTVALLHPMQDLMNGTYTQTLESIRAISPIPETVISTAESLLTEQDPKRFYYALDGHLNVEGARRVAGHL